MSRYRLSKINPDLYDSIAAFRKEILDNDGNFDGCQQLDKYEDIEKWHLNNKLFESVTTVPPGYSIGYVFAYLDEDEVVGMINLRPLAERHVYLQKYGGHIGYSIKPSRRKQGIATEMLKDMMKVAKEEYGLKRLLITCMKDNIASEKVIINNGGVFESEVFYAPEEKYLKRYWISL